MQQKAGRVKKIIKMRSVAAVGRWHTINKELQPHLKILCYNDIDNFDIVERWVTHPALGTRQTEKDQHHGP